MTREEAIKRLKLIDSIISCECVIREQYEMYNEAIRMAIESLSAEQKEEELAEDIARRMATIIENEQDMRVILKNASDDRPTEEWKINCTDFVDWLLEKVLDEEDWDMNYQAYGEIICRKLKKLGVVTVKDGYYIIADDADRPSGEWKHNNKSGTFKIFTCSKCGLNIETDGWDYCPNCGAKMGGNK